MRLAILNVTRRSVSLGQRRELEHLIPRLDGAPGIEAVLCAAPASVGLDRWFRGLSRVRFTESRAYRPLHHRPDPKLLAELRRFRPDVLYVPLERYVKFDDVPVVSVIRNMLPLTLLLSGYPLRLKLSMRIQWLEARIAVRRADRIVAVSDHVREFLVERWGVPAAKVSRVYHGSGKPLEPTEADRPSAVPPDWKGGFVFTAGSILPYRGLEDLIAAAPRLTGSGIRGIVIAGDPSPGCERYARQLQRSSEGRAENLIWTGGLTPEAMAWCFRSCAVFAMTSRLESFGIVGAEAMSHGCLSVVAENSKQPEVFSDAAIYYRPGDGSSLASGIRKAIALGEDDRRKLSERAVRRAAGFSWETQADELLAAFELTRRERAR